MYSIQTITDKNIWEKFLLEYSPHSFFHSWDWGQVVESEGLEVERIGVVKDAQLDAIVQIVTIKAKRGTFLHLRHGPVLKNWSKELVQKILDHLNLYAKERKAVFVRISPLVNSHGEAVDILKTCGFKDAPIHAMDGEYVWVLDIKKAEEELLRDMRKTTRYLIKKAQNIGVKIEKSVDINDFYALYDHTAKRHGFIKHSGIDTEFKIFSKNNNAILLTGKHENKLIAAALIVFYGNQAIYRHGASIPSDIPAAYLLQWEAIREAKKRGCSLYNFWGIAPAEKTNHPWRGISLFKMGFGGGVVSYMHAKDKVYSKKYIATFAIESLRRIKKGY